MKVFIFKLSKCKDSHNEERLSKDEGWYAKKCALTAYGTTICKNHGYDLSEFDDPFDFEMIGTVALKKEGDFKYTTIPIKDRGQRELLKMMFTLEPSYELMHNKS